MKTQVDNLIMRCYKALAEGIDKQAEDQLLINLELYTQQREQEEVALQTSDNSQLN